MLSKLDPRPLVAKYGKTKVVLAAFALVVLLGVMLTIGVDSASLND